MFDDQRERFERVVLALRRIGEFIDTDACADILDGKRVLDGRYFHLSFDDGYRNVFTNAIPVLARYGIPAIVFVGTSLVGADREAARRYCRKIWDGRSIRPFTGVAEMIRWTDLREMVTAGFEVGSHSRTHACLAAVSSDAARLHDEIHGSKREIESRLGTECKYLSWPFGTMKDVDAASFETIRGAGYRAAFGAFRGSVRPQVTDRFRIPRHHFEVQFPIPHILYFARGGKEARWWES